MPKDKKPRKKNYAFSGTKRPDNTKKFVNKAIQQSVVFHQQGKIEEALDITKQALEYAPGNINLLDNAGAFSAMLKNFEQSKKYLSKSLEIKPKNLNTLNNLSSVLAELKQYEQANDMYKKILELKPNDVNAHSNLANTLQQQESYDEAKKHYLISIQLDPNSALIHSNLGVLYKKQKQFDKAEDCYQNALNLKPNFLEVHNNLGLLLKEQKQFNKSKEHYQIALTINPNYADARWNLSLLELTLTDFNQGWKNHESRYHVNKQDKELMGVILPITLTPQYQSNNPNQDLANKHLLIIPEQGVGDEIMFASVLSELKPIATQNPNTKITLSCDTRLVDLFNSSFDFLNAIPKDPDNLYAQLEKDLDYWMFIGSLPKFYRNDIKVFDKHKPYLKVDDALLARWQTRLEQLPHTMNIGISWAGGKNAEQQKDRSLTLEQLTPILEKANQQANIINLQYGDHIQAIEQFSAQTGITIHDWGDADPLKDLDNFAAQISALDLVISIDNSTVHFSGALGVQTLVMLPFYQDWRWGEDRDDSYWYPNTMQLFRQPTDGDWDSVIQKVAGHLNDILNHS